METSDNGDIILTIKIGVRKFKVVLPAQRRHKEEKEHIELDKGLNERMVEEKLLEIRKQFDSKFE